MSVSVIRKTISLLEMIADTPQAVSLAELAARTKIPKATALRILKTLRELGYLAQEESSGSYLISNKMNLIASAQTRHLLIKTARPLMQSLYDQFNENINLGVIEDLSIAYFDCIETKKPLRWVVHSSKTDPCYSTALGRAIIASMPKIEIDRLLLRIVFEPRTANTVTSLETFKTIIAQTQVRGWAIEEHENDEGIVCMGLSLAPYGLPYAGLSITIPKPRFHYSLQEKIAKAFKLLTHKFPPT